MLQHCHNVTYPVPTTSRLSGTGRTGVNFTTQRRGHPSEHMQNRRRAFAHLQCNPSLVYQYTWLGPAVTCKAAQISARDGRGQEQHSCIPTLLPHHTYPKPARTVPWLAGIAALSSSPLCPLPVLLGHSFDGYPQHVSHVIHGKEVLMGAAGMPPLTSF